MITQDFYTNYYGIQALANADHDSTMDDIRLSLD